MKSYEFSLLLLEKYEGLQREPLVLSCLFFMKYLNKVVVTF